MALSGRDRRILSEIERELTLAEPLLARALATGQVPTRRRSLLAARAGERPDRSVTITVAIVSCLASGIAVLTVGLVLGILALVCAGAVLTQLSPAAVGYLYRRARRARR